MIWLAAKCFITPLLCRMVKSIAKYIFVRSRLSLFENIRGACHATHALNQRDVTPGPRSIYPPPLPSLSAFPASRSRHASFSSKFTPPPLCHGWRNLRNAFENLKVSNKWIEVTIALPSFQWLALLLDMYEEARSKRRATEARFFGTVMGGSSASPARERVKLEKGNMAMFKCPQVPTSSHAPSCSSTPRMPST